MAEQGAQKVINGVTYEFINGQWRIKLKPKAQEPSGQIVIKRDPRVILKGVDGAPVPNTYFGTDKYGIPKYLPIQEFIKKIIEEFPTIEHLPIEYIYEVIEVTQDQQIEFTVPPYSAADKTYIIYNGLHYFYIHDYNLVDTLLTWNDYMLEEGEQLYFYYLEPY